MFLTSKLPKVVSKADFQNLHEILFRDSNLTFFDYTRKYTEKTKFGRHPMPELKTLSKLKGRPLTATHRGDLTIISGDSFRTRTKTRTYR